jgi:hypothetical protein
MIVKNEAHVIKETLENLCSFINFSYYVISDTGSTDNTVEIIQQYFLDKNIKGEIFNNEWKDFGYNRTLALQQAYNKTDYLFIYDADDTVIGNLKLIDKLEKDSYYFKFGGSLFYKRVLLINNRLKWKFVGVLHEYLSCIDKNEPSHELIDGDYYVHSGKTGGRSKDKYKYQKDALVIEKAYYEADERNDHLKVRYSFYCAQSYRDCNDHEKAIEWYKKRVSLKDWNQEVYFSYYMIGKIYYYNLNQPELAIYYWTLGIEADTERYETLCEIISHFRKNGNIKLAYQYYLMISQLDVTNKFFEDKLFTVKQVYDYLMYYELSIILCYNNKHSDAIPIFNKLLNFKLYNVIPYDVKINILDNFIFYYEYCNETNFNKNDILNYFNFIKNIYYEKNKLEYKQINCINKVIEKIKTFNFDKDIIINKLIQRIPGGLAPEAETLDGRSEGSSGACERLQNNISRSTSNNSNNIKILLSITSCKRYKLFIETVNSFIKNCLDIDQIDYFFCVDDNSSKEDRDKMFSEFPFFEYYFKGEEEKGHLKSMNIIWNKLNELKPTYWIHLEDDWLFFKPDNYIQKSINFLENKDNFENKIHQILFNKNYGETIEHYNLVGGKKLENNVLLHIKDENVVGVNSAYWPHYSFRPSMCNVNTILELGNYDSENTFFERDYADKWHCAGYQSAYFNEITCLHIGRLTNERNSNINNAYSLNNEQQFDENNKIHKISENISNNITINNIIYENNKNQTFINFNELDNNLKYIFIKNMDHVGDDIVYHQNFLPEENIKFCEELEDCIGFNTLGYFKNNIDLTKLQKVDIFKEDGGLFINIEKFKNKYGIK